MTQIFHKCQPSRHDDTKGAIRSRKSKTGKKCNGQAENDKWTNKMMLDISGCVIVD